MTKQFDKTLTKSRQRQNKPWFNDECRARRSAYLKLKRRLSRQQTEEASAALKNEAKAYKRYIRKASREYYESVHESLRHLRTNDPKSTGASSIGLLKPPLMITT